MSSNHVDAYQAIRPLYETLRVRTEELLRAVLKEAGIDYHVVESRTKSIESFQEKVQRGGKNYKDPINDLDDLCGCRVIVYYQDDCDRVANLIRNEFEIRQEELSHQPDQLDADRFGYLSAHYVVGVAKNRRTLTEWKPIADLRVEIQLRTVIQHAWSAVSHAVQYKEESRVPSRLQRRLYRIAGLFELADEEFIGIRDQKRDLQRAVSAALSAGNKDISLNTTSILEFCLNWSGLSRALESAGAAGFVVDEYDENDSLIADIYEFSELCDIGTVGQLERSLATDYDQFFKQSVSIYYSLEPNGKGKWHTSPDFVVLLLLFAGRRDKFSLSYLIDNGWAHANAKAIANAIKKCWPAA